MTITPDLIQYIIYIIIIVSIIIFIVKKAVAVAITLGIILLLFNIGFRFNGTDVMDKLGLDKYLKPQASTTISSFFDDFAQKRDQYGIVDADKVYNEMTNAIDTGYYIIVDGLGKVDVNKFAKTLAKNIYDAGLKNIDFNQLVAEIQKQLKVTPAEATTIAQQVQADYQGIKDGTSDNVLVPTNTFGK